ncbi:MAG: SurA N-terminal domain-containing protein [Pseudomonadota bacterium]|nr:SurA N-terminal domain-containing protein [Pseudomonadota bacterium]
MKIFTLTKIVAVSLLLISAFLLPAGAESKGSEILAEIDGQKITRADFTAYLSLFKDQGKYQPTTTAAREKLLNNLIDRTLLLEEARKQGYFNAPELKKHGSLNSTEHETIVLRKFLTDRISRPATIDDKTVSTYLETQTNLTFKQAQEKLTSERQLQLFQELMQNLKKERKIIIHQENLKNI